MLWFMEGICFLPFFLVIWSSSTFIVSYLIALFEHDVDVIFPYISDTGAKPPESCVFGLMTVITAFASMATMYARYKFVEKLNEKAGGVPPVLNQAALWIGTLSCLGMCFVATFQETTITAVHDAAVVCAVFVTQTTLHRKTEDEDNVFHLVSAVSEWIVAFSFIFFFFTYIHDFKKFTLKLRTQFVDYS
ncbi:DNA damage-regulated autophagy modulator protein 1-like isoform 2-T2 [Salvelinus alpinus]|uniref:DNA damage-regulated autophagy modulator protein 1 isoform X2 n=1 Tax=Salvelinus sp. IW2-2015 TaxID=2691554 RepID=UPI000CDFD75D|nr:DNA damage-regulated autophagy modulator protein 1 isoform X2 [Salvelinus alpinus]